jgi:hypothetical protein
MPQIARLIRTAAIGVAAFLLASSETAAQTGACQAATAATVNVIVVTVGYAIPGTSLSERDVLYGNLQGAWYPLARRSDGLGWQLPVRGLARALTTADLQAFTIQRELADQLWQFEKIVGPTIDGAAQGSCEARFNFRGRQRWSVEVKSDAPIPVQLCQTCEAIVEDATASNVLRKRTTFATDPLVIGERMNMTLDFRAGCMVPVVVTDREIVLTDGTKKRFSSAGDKGVELSNDEIRKTCDAKLVSGYIPAAVINALYAIIREQPDPHAVTFQRVP